MVIVLDLYKWRGMDRMGMDSIREESRGMDRHGKF
jgi:hypothetical protein